MWKVVFEGREGQDPWSSVSMLMAKSPARDARTWVALSPAIRKGDIYHIRRLWVWYA